MNQQEREGKSRKTWDLASTTEEREKKGVGEWRLSRVMSVRKDF